MDYLQYFVTFALYKLESLSVLNLVINGLPSILSNMWSHPNYTYEEF